MNNGADYDIDLTIPPELLEAMREHEWRTLLTCMAEGHQWIARSHGQKQCKACGDERGGTMPRTTGVQDIHRLTPQGTNSTFFTACCNAAICDDEQRCPACKDLVIGHDAKPGADRNRARWRFATAHWRGERK